mmetsp:Transcript_14181/g.29686  ORF Transcript_14181/g.29686 Transcript_14181/m.29686 type:complete len:224 (-) Transcript_14181:643-1314(-)
MRVLLLSMGWLGFYLYLYLCHLFIVFIYFVVMIKTTRYPVLFVFVFVLWLSFGTQCILVVGSHGPGTQCVEIIENVEMMMQAMGVGGFHREQFRSAIVVSVMFQSGREFLHRRYSFASGGSSGGSIVRVMMRFGHELIQLALLLLLLLLELNVIVIIRQGNAIRKGVALTSHHHDVVVVVVALDSDSIDVVVVDGVNDGVVAIVFIVAHHSHVILVLFLFVRR